MPCEICENSVGKSNDEIFFRPPSGSCNDIKYVCQCGQIWIQKNVSFHLWEKATPEEWQAWEEKLRNPKPDW